MAVLNRTRLSEALTKALTPWFLGPEQAALIEAIRLGGEETLLAVAVDTDALQAQFTNLYSLNGAGSIGIADAGNYFPGTTVEAALQQLGASTAGGPYIPLAQKGAANGVATLDGTTKIPLAQIPFDAGVVHTTGNESIAGNKTFSGLTIHSQTGAATESIRISNTTDGKRLHMAAGTAGATVQAQNSDLILDAFDVSQSVRVRTQGVDKLVVSPTTATFSNTVTASDITSSRTASPTQGYFFTGNTGLKYFGFDGTNYIMPGANLWVNGSPVAMDNAVVHLAGNETVAGTKTFTGHISSTTLATGSSNTSVAFGAQHTTHSPNGSPVFVNLWQSGVFSGGIGSLASSNTMRVVNTSATGLLADGLGLDIDPGGRVGVGGNPGATAFYQLKVYGGVQTTGASSQIQVEDRTIPADIYALYATGGSFRLYNGSGDIVTITKAGLWSGTGISEVSVPFSLARRNSGGYLYAEYFNSTATATYTGAVSNMWVEEGSDGFIRKHTLSQFLSADCAASDANFRDVRGNRGDGTGVIYFGSGGGKYLYWDGTNYNLPGGSGVVAVNFTATSDKRLKEEINYIAPRDLSTLGLATWKWKESGASGIGPIAQDVQKLAPEYVVTGADGFLSVDKGGLAIEIAMKALQEVKRLQGIIDALTSQSTD